MRRTNVKAAIEVLLNIFCLVSAATMLILVRTTLQANFSGSSVCYLSSTNDASPCSKVFGLALVSCALSMLLALFQFIHCKLCGIAFILDFAIAVSGTIWWVAGSLFLEQQVAKANAVKVGNQSSRDAVYVLSIVSALSYMLSLALTSYALFKECVTRKPQMQHDFEV